MLSFTRNGRQTLPPTTTIEFPNDHILSGYKIVIFTTSQQKSREHEDTLPSAIEAMINKEEPNFSSLTTKIRVDIFNRNQKNTLASLLAKKISLQHWKKLLAKKSKRSKNSKIAIQRKKLE